MDGEAGEDVRQPHSTFKYPAANRSKLSYGSQRKTGSLAYPRSSSRPRKLRKCDEYTVDRNSPENDDLPLDAFDRELLAELKNLPLQESSNELYTSEENAFTSGKRSSGGFQGSLTRISSPSEPDTSESPLKEFLKGTGMTTISPHWKSPIKFPSPHTPCSSRGPISHVEPPEIQLKHAPPVIQGIQLVSTHDLPDRFRSIFPFSVFNAVQSKCFQSIYRNDDNFVLSAPTGSGKTVIMELAICRLISTIKDSRFKVVYQAPTKSLCSERFRDWRSKFATLDLQCAELTGDTDQAQLRNVQNASIIITTPEKWDSMTRKWKDHGRLMQLIRLFLIDEVHILKESRGATLEAVVSRMKSLDSNVRFVALSATVPNSEDIATWLGRDPTSQHLPARRERFGEEFRPVKLQKFVYGYQSNGNDFAFDKVCDSKLPEVISKHSQRKPIMIFCCTRNSAISTAKNLAKLWTVTNTPHRLWNGPKRIINVQNLDLKATISAGVAFHHAGLDAGDRHAIESSYLEGQINVICCTSTLAVGVNLPCQLVIIKNTVSWQENCCKEYTDLEMMQMLGRAGRPQFDTSATAVILTRKERVDHYQKLVTGSGPLESCLHLNLIDHLNAEIGLGTVRDLETATKWLSGTFFFTRLHKNPTHYKLKEGCEREDEEELMREICEKDINLLQECSLITDQVPLKSTAFGDAMARYYIKFETMKSFMGLPTKAKISEILSIIVQADEFRDVRLKAGEKSLYKEINKENGIKYPVKVDIGLPSHKISLLIQSELGGVEMPAAEQYQKHRLTFQQDKALVLSHVNRLIRCIIDCQIARGDSVSARHALELARSLGARVWDNSPLQMKQLEQIGIVAVRKLANAGITSIDSLETTEAYRIDTILSKNPPFGTKLLGRLSAFPKPRVTVKMVGKETKPGKHPVVKFNVEIGFINEKPPLFFHRKPVYVCLLAETSDGRIIDFRRTSANKLQNGQDITLRAELTHPCQHITCYVMCDEIAGTQRQAELKPNLPESLFIGARPSESKVILAKREALTLLSSTRDTRRLAKEIDDFSDDFLNDADLIAAADDFNPRGGKKCSKRTPGPSKPPIRQPSVSGSLGEPDGPTQLENGKWTCSHRCKDKTACKHFCCREGVDRPSKPSKKPTTKEPVRNVSKRAQEQIQWKPSNPDLVQKKGHNDWQDDDIDVIDLTGPSTVVKSTPRFKYVKKRSDKDSESRKSYFSQAREVPSKVPAKKAEIGYIGPGLLPESVSDKGLDTTAENNDRSSDFGSFDIDNLFPVKTTLGLHDEELPASVSAIDDIIYEDTFNINTDDAFSASELNEAHPANYEQCFLPREVSPTLVDREDTRLPEGETLNSSETSPTNCKTSIFSPTGVNSLINPDISSDSLFFNTPLQPKMIRRRDDYEKEELEGVEESGTGSNKRPRLEPDIDSTPAEVPQGWEGIDLALIEEFKDIVDFV